MRWHFPISNQGMNCSYNTRLIPGSTKYMRNNMRSCCFPVCPGYSNHPHFSRRIVKKIGHHIFHRFSGTLDIDDSSSCRNLYFFLCNNRYSTFFYRILNKVMSINFCSGKTKKQTPLPNFPGICCDITYIYIIRTIYLPVYRIF